MSPVIIQKSPGKPTKGRKEVFMPKMAASRVRGKTITAKMVSTFTISLVLSVSKALLVCSKDSMVCLAAIRLLVHFAQWFRSLEKYGARCSPKNSGEIS